MDANQLGQLNDQLLVSYANLGMQATSLEREAAELRQEQEVVGRRLAQTSNEIRSRASAAAPPESFAPAPVPEPSAEASPATPTKAVAPKAQQHKKRR